MSAGAPPRLEVEGLSRLYGSHIALDDVSFSVDASDFLVLLGPNGAGKTTLVKILARLTRPSSGAVRLDGEDWLGAPPDRQRELGVVSHATYLYDGLTATENLQFFAHLYGLDAPADRAVEALAGVGLEGLADQRAGTMSRGQAQRLSIARAVLHQPRMLILDEPYAGLDPHAARTLGEALSRLHADGRTIVMTTHDLARAPRTSTRFLVLVEGRVRLQGTQAGATPAELEAAYEEAVIGAVAP